MKKSCASKASYQRCYAKKKVANVCIYSTCVHAKGGGGRGIGILKNWKKKRRESTTMRCNAIQLGLRKKRKKKK